MEGYYWMSERGLLYFGDGNQTIEVSKPADEPIQSKRIPWWRLIVARIRGWFGYDSIIPIMLPNIGRVTVRWSKDTKSIAEVYRVITKFPTTPPTDNNQ